jgi:hypothetical protein
MIHQRAASPNRYTAPSQPDLKISCDAVFGRPAGTATSLSTRGAASLPERRRRGVCSDTNLAGLHRSCMDCYQKSWPTPDICRLIFFPSSTPQSPCTTTSSLCVIWPRYPPLTGWGCKSSHVPQCSPDYWGDYPVMRGVFPHGEDMSAAIGWRSKRRLRRAENDFDAAIVIKPPDEHCDSAFSTRPGSLREYFRGPL